MLPVFAHGVFHLPPPLAPNFLFILLYSHFNTTLDWPMCQMKGGKHLP